MPNAPFTWGAQGPLSLQPGNIQLTNGMNLGNDGPKNYLTYNNAETNTTTGWSLGTVTLTSAFPSGTPTFGSGASGNLSLGVSSSSPIDGTYSYTYTSSAATTAGNFLASDAFTISTADQAKPLTVQFYYTPSSNPTNGNFSGTSSNSFGIALYDVTTGGSTGWIMPAGVWSMTQNSGVGIATATFQTTAASTQYRLVIFNANATSGAITLKFDRFFVGPQTRPLGFVGTDWVASTSVTTSGFGTISNLVYKSRRVGDSLQVYCAFTAGTVAASQAQIGVVYQNAALTVDTSKSGVAQLCGQFGSNSASATFFAESIISPSANQTYVNVGVQSSTTSLLVAANGSVATSSSTNVQCTFTVPIVGWSSQVQSASDTDTRVIDFRATKTTGTTTANTAITFDSVTRDSAGAYSTGTGAYTVPVSGDYLVAAKFSATTTGANVTNLLVNGSVVSCGSMGDTGSAGYTGCVDILANLKAGDQITVTMGASKTLSFSTTGLNTLYIARISGPAVIAATDLVACSYYCSANFATTTSTPINFDSKEFDLTNSVTVSATAWRFTAPVSGTYSIQGNGYSASGCAAILYKNGTAYKGCGAIAPAATLVGELGCTIKLNAGDYIDIRPNTSVTVGGGSLNAHTTCNISITRMGF